MTTNRELAENLVREMFNRTPADRILILERAIAAVRERCAMVIQAEIDSLGQSAEMSSERGALKLVRDRIRHQVKI